MYTRRVQRTRDVNSKNSLFEIGSVMRREGNIREEGEDKKIYIYMYAEKKEEERKKRGKKGEGDEERRGKRRSAR